MKPIEIVKEIVVRMPDQNGELAKVLTPIAEARINLRSINLTGFGNEGLLRLHVEDNAKVLDILKRGNFIAWEQDVLAVEISNEPGNAAQVATKIAHKGVDIRGLYASTGTGGNTVMYVWTNDNAKALSVLK